ncbi:CRISPR-associated endoribonuclease Cas6 [Romeria aff. gracilis LEGE 07310]|uniref:CRISPR-associated endoribonuclease Cas6 n=1 Tax=Vasconcelosia minhoensis LEGE 07310 TaxID=915328 RepID=A0A8J7AR79_9CYAN|nr:CRISPR-associated endoribonuclease Cas6 [Romeria gracilis]MBE9078961.1 CRISPR-associated endoribonuclease Cas6 [Romeria aff. gracilis LEGE 07310]
MPHSLVLNLLPQSPIPPGFTSGKHLHALFLSLVSTVEPELANQLHANQGNKAFTLSPLQVSPPPHPSTHPPIHWNHLQSVPPNTPCWWRISLLDDRLFSRLNPLWLNLNPQHPWHLGPADLHITSILGTRQSTQPWANFSSYGQLCEQASEQERKLILQFCTPTAFRQGKYDSAMPTPERVFGSLLRRWNAYSGQDFPKAILESLQPSYFEIRTQLATDPRSQFQHTGAQTSPCNQFMGCVGKVTYQILGRVDTEAVKQLNTLANYAFYAGVGRKTPMGMGMSRRVDG